MGSIRSTSTRVGPPPSVAMYSSTFSLGFRKVPVTVRPRRSTQSLRSLSLSAAPTAICCRPRMRNGRVILAPFSQGGRPQQPALSSRGTLPGWRLNMTSPQQAASVPPVVLFDGVCNLCNGAVNFLIDRDPKGELRFAAWQSKAAADLLRALGHEAPAPEPDTILFVEGGRVY